MTYVDRECAFWSCDFAHLFLFQKKLKNAMLNSLFGGMGGGKGNRIVSMIKSRCEFVSVGPAIHQSLKTMKNVNTIKLSLNVKY